MNLASRSQIDALVIPRKKSKAEEGNEGLQQVQLHFTFQKKIGFGRGLYIVGNLKEFGSWDPIYSVKLFWNEGDNWTQTVTIYIDPIIPTVFEYKLVETDYSRLEQSSLVWEDGPNRILDICFEENNGSSPTIKEGNNCDSNRNQIVSIDCHNLTFKALGKKLRSSQSEDFILVRNIEQKLLKEALPLMRRHMVYFPEDCPSLVCPVFYRQDKWRLVKARTYVLDNVHYGSWAFFRGKLATKLITNHHSISGSTKIFDNWINLEQSSGEIPLANYLPPIPQGSLVFKENSEFPSRTKSCSKSGSKPLETTAVAKIIFQLG